MLFSVVLMFHTAISTLTIYMDHVNLFVRNLGTQEKMLLSSFLRDDLYMFEMIPCISWLRTSICTLQQVVFESGNAIPIFFFFSAKGFGSMLEIYGANDTWLLE